MEYITAPKPDGHGHESPFAQLPCGEDRACLIVSRREHTYLVLNKYPYNAGHLLAVPYREVAKLAELKKEERLCLMEAVIEGQDLLSRAFRPDGFNVGINLGAAAGAGIPKHLHVHIVPRWSGDTNFMPVLGKTRVLPQSLDAVWERLTELRGASADSTEQSGETPAQGD